MTVYQFPLTLPEGVEPRDWNDAAVRRKPREALSAELRAADLLDFFRAAVDSSHLRAMKSGAKTGLPVDLGEHHVITAAPGIPPAATTAGGSHNDDVTRLILQTQAVVRQWASSASVVQLASSGRMRAVEESGCAV